MWPIYDMYNITITKPCSKDQYMYQCIDGSCHTGSFGICQPILGYCPNLTTRRHYCPAEDFCQYTDFNCLRPCGVSNGRLNYIHNCTGYPGLCTNNPETCPPQCLKTEIKCRKEGKCAKSAHYCTTCDGFRCASDGKCGFGTRCNGIGECSDGSDETGCFGNNNNVDKYATVGLLFVVVLITGLCCFCFCKRRRRRRRERRRFERPSVPPLDTETVTLSVRTSSHFNQDGVTLVASHGSDTATPTHPSSESPSTPPPPSYFDVIQEGAHNIPPASSGSQSELPSYDEIMSQEQNGKG